MDKIEAHLRKLSEQDGDRILTGLETDIWAGVAARAKAREASRWIISCQAAVMVVAVIGSAAIGVHFATPPASSSQVLSSFSSRIAFAPSTLLLGSRQ